MITKYGQGDDNNGRGVFVNNKQRAQIQWLISSPYRPRTTSMLTQRGSAVSEAGLDALKLHQGLVYEVLFAKIRRTTIRSCQNGVTVTTTSL